MSKLRDDYNRIVYTLPPSPVTLQTRRPLLNPTFGNDLAQAPVFSGTPVVVTDGGDTAGWTASSTQGTWDFTSTTNPFAGTGCVELTGGADGDIASFLSGSSIDGSTYIALEIEIRLESWSSDNNTLLIQAYDGIVPVGNSTDLTEVINPNILNVYQNAIIPLDQLGLDTETFDNFSITVTRSSGGPVALRFDDFRLEESGGILEYRATVHSDEILNAEKLRFTFVAAVTGGAALHYDDLLGETLINGLVIDRFINGEIATGRNIKSRSDFYSFDFNTVDFEDDGVNSTWVVEVEFETPFILTGSLGDFISVNVQDDISGLIRAEALLTATTFKEI